MMERIVLLLSFRGERTRISKEALTLMGIPIQYQGLTWDNYKFPSEALSKLLLGYTEHCDEMFDDSINLLFTGTNGVGKSLVSSIILQNCYARYYSTRMITFKDFITKSFNGDDTSEYWNTEFLVVDELGAEVSLKSNAEKSLIEELLKYRFAKGFPTIICSNLDKATLKARYGNTLYSMLSEFICVEIKGTDGRQEAFRKKKALEYLK